MVGKVRRCPDGGLFRIKAIAQHMVLSLSILTGELDALHKGRIPGLQQGPHGGAALGGIVVRQGENVQPGRPNSLQKSPGRICTVGIHAMHMQVRAVKGCLLHRAASRSFFPRRSRTRNGR